MTMTAEQHNRYLGMAFLAYGGLQALIALLLTGFFVFIMVMSGEGPEGPPPALMAVFMAFMLVMQAAFMVPSFVAGYGLLKRRRWARIAAIIGSILAAMSFPFGTGLCVYGLWFLFGQKGRSLYEDGGEFAGSPPPVDHMLSSVEPMVWKEKSDDREHDSVNLNR